MKTFASLTFQYALSEYMSVFRQDPENPLISLMLGLTFTHMACQRFSSNKHSLVIQVEKDHVSTKSQDIKYCTYSIQWVNCFSNCPFQATAFLQHYLKLRGECQESYYNLGRAHHQLGILPAAIHYYKRALEQPVAIKNHSGGDDPMFNLHREIAFNLSLIYRSSGATNLAKLYVAKYIVV